MDNDPYIIAFKTIIHCLPINNYIINTIDNIITYYCGNNNTITMSYNYIESIIERCRY
jgi:hypothetical protein